MSALDIAARIVRPDDLRAVLRNTPSYNRNRDRVGTLLAEGFAAYDQYQKAKPYIFWGSLAGAALSAYYFQTRGRRHDNREAMVLYGASLAACAAAAWVTRPTPPTELPDDAPPGAQPSQDGALVAWVDERAAARRAQDPRFVDASINRLLSMPGVQQSFQDLHPLVRATVV
jgi:hypothetical protein